MVIITADADMAQILGIRTHISVASYTVQGILICLQGDHIGEKQEC